MLQKCRNAGFTLLEVLIAIAIFAMLGIASNSVLQTVLKSDEITKKHTQDIKQIQLTMGVIERDLLQLVAKRIRNSTRLLPKVIMHDQDNSGQDQNLTFTRVGWLNPDGLLPRSTLQTIKYYLDDGVFYRDYFIHPSVVEGQEPKNDVMFENVKALKFRFYERGAWVESVKGRTLPDAIEIFIEFNDGYTILRHFLIAHQ